MNLRVNQDLCAGYGTCVDIAPDLFEFDEWGYAQAAGTGEVPPGREQLANQAMLACPMNAIACDD